MYNLRKVINVKLKMNWDEDIDLLAGRKSMPKQGRRAGLTNTPESAENLLDNVLDTFENVSEAPVRTKKTGGWADEPKSAKNRTATNILEQERFQDDSNTVDDDDDIPIIPDIDDIQDDLTTMQEVKTPNLTINKATYKALDTELASQNSSRINFDKLEDINLTFLTKHLYPEETVKEPLDVWSVDSLFEELIIKNAAS